MVGLGLGLGLSRSVSGGGDAPVSPYLDGDLSSVVFEVDATQEESYNGSGNTWFNLTSSPADGETQSRYDHLGAEESTTLATFNGTAGDTGAYWTGDGTQYFGINENPTTDPTTDFLEGLVNGNGSNPWWCALAFGFDTITWTSTTWGLTVFSQKGLFLQSQSNERLKFGVSNDTGVAQSNYDLNYALGGARDNNVAILSYNSSDTFRIWQQSTTAVEKSITIGSNSSVSNIYRFMDTGTSGGPDYLKFRAWAMGNEFLDNTKAQAIMDNWGTRHGLSYY